MYLTMEWKIAYTLGSERHNRKIRILNCSDICIIVLRCWSWVQTSPKLLTQLLTYTYIYYMFVGSICTNALMPLIIDVSALKAY
jgi:hypothetical protein